MTAVVNLYGGPGVGKSTSAAYLFYLLKAAGCNAELVREYVKEWAWEGRRINDYDQMYFLGKQLRKESLLYGRASHVVTDSPVLLGVYYARCFSPPHLAGGVEAAARAYYAQAEEDGHRHYHVLLHRSKPYREEGRFQTEGEARQIDDGVGDLLDSWRRRGGFRYFECGTDRHDLEVLLANILYSEAKEEKSCSKSIG